MLSAWVKCVGWICCSPTLCVVKYAPPPLESNLCSPPAIYVNPAPFSGISPPMVTYMRYTTAEDSYLDSYLDSTRYLKIERLYLVSITHSKIDKDRRVQIAISTKIEEYR